MWRVRWHELGRVRRKFFKSRVQAESFAARLNGERLLARQRLELLPAAEQEQLMAIHAEAARRGLPLPAVLGLVAAGWAQKTNAPGLATALDDMLKAKRNAGRAERYLASLSAIVRAFGRGREAWPVDRFSLREVELFLDGHNAGSRSTLRSRLATFFKFAVRRGWRADNPCALLEPVRLVRQPPRIFTVDEVERALDWLRTRPKAFGWFALATFAGLRPEEAAGTRWREVNFVEGWIRVEAQTSKVRQRRVVYPPDKAMRLLREAKRRGAQLPLTRKALQIERNELRRALGLAKWPQDVTRHTAASMWLAATGDAAKVAAALGHSEAVLHTNYKALVTKAEAVKFWR